MNAAGCLRNAGLLDEPTTPRVVIVGGGFAGLEAARVIASSSAHVTLVDCQNHHCFQPLLYQVATAALSPADIAWPIRALVRRHQTVDVLMGTVEGVDTQRCLVMSDTATLAYDYLVLAAGATHSYYGHPQWADVAPGLKRIENATNIRRRLLLAFERAEVQDDGEERRRLLTFAIIGAGPTGVELAGAVAEVARHTLPADFRQIDTRSARVVLVEAGPRVLPYFSESTSAYTQHALKQMGVEVLTSTRVTACDEHGIQLEDQRIEAATIFWAAGVVASPAAQWIKAEHDHVGRIKVRSDLRVPRFSNVFAIGDTASVPQETGKPVPGLAPAAKQMGRYVGDVITAEIEGRPLPPPFRYRHQGDLATIGRREAVVEFRGIHLRGLIGWLFWCFAHVYFLIGARNRLVVALTWIWSYATYQRGARLITMDGSGQAAGCSARSTRNTGTLPISASEKASSEARNTFATER